MHKFSVLPAETTTHMACYSALNEKAATFLDDELDVREVGVSLGYSTYVSLHHLSLNPGVALKRLGCENISEVLATWAYACGFSNGITRHSVIPLGFMTRYVQGLLKYHQAFETYAGNGSSSYLHLLPDVSRFHADDLREHRDGRSRYLLSERGIRYEVTRFEQIYAGAGYSLEMLSAKHRDMCLRPVQLNLSNDDILLAYAYKDLAQSPD